MVQESMATNSVALCLIVNWLVGVFNQFEWQLCWFYSDLPSFVEHDHGVSCGHVLAIWIS